MREDHQIQQRVADLVRDSYGRLLAVLAAPTRDIAAAEDALADAMERALPRWPDDGIPANPEGWILTVARNRLRDLWKSSAYRMTEPLTEIDDTSSDFETKTCPPSQTAGWSSCWCAPIPPSPRTSARR